MIELSVTQTSLALVPLLLAGIVTYKITATGKDIAAAGARMVLQLVAIGYFLIFLFESDQLWLNLAVLGAMSSIASWIALRPLENKSFYHWGIMLLCMTLVGSIILIWLLTLVIQPEPWYQSSVFIPLSGMLFSNGMNTLSLAAERFENDRNFCDDENARQHAFKTAMIPQINSLLSVGLVTLPGMMTGQILAGVSPLTAVRYQIMVMSMLLGMSSICLYLYLRCLPMIYRHSYQDK